MATKAPVGKPIEMRERVKVRITEKNPNGKTGDILEVHPKAAEHGFSLGHYEPVKEK